MTSQQNYYSGIFSDSSEQISIKLSFIKDEGNNNEYFVIFFDDKKLVCKVMDSNDKIKKKLAWRGF